VKLQSFKRIKLKKTGPKNGEKLPRVKVKLFGRFRDIADEGELEVESQRVSELIDVLTEKFGEKLRKELLDMEGKLRPFHNILVNGVRIDPSNKFCTELRKDDVIAFFSPVGGG
jgi:MoaD family protein